MRLGPGRLPGLNVQGSNDNYPYLDTEAGTACRSAATLRSSGSNEEIARKAAGFRWLEEGFDYAARVHAKGVMIIWQADPNFNNEQHLTNPHDWDRYPDYVNELRSLTEAFDGQVALVHGDSHYFKVDKPINHTTGDGVRNFTRVETFRRATRIGECPIDGRDPNVFIFVRGSFQLTRNESDFGRGERGFTAYSRDRGVLVSPTSGTSACKVVGACALARRGASGHPWLAWMVDASVGKQPERAVEHVDATVRNRIDHQAHLGRFSATNRVLRLHRGLEHHREFTPRFSPFDVLS